MRDFSIAANPDLNDGPAAGTAGLAVNGISPEPPAATDVFLYEDYRAYMRDRFAELQALSPAFSQRGLARKAGITNPGFFNEVIKGRRRLSLAASSKIAIGLDLSPRETEYFTTLVFYTEAREPVSKLRAGKRLVALKNRQLYHTLQAMPSLTETLRGIVQELEKDWVLQAAGLSVDHDAQEVSQPILDPMSEDSLNEILEKLISVRSQADAAPDSRVVQFSLRAARRMDRPVS